jgi:hypothetical protein
MGGNRKAKDRLNEEERKRTRPKVGYSAEFEAEVGMILEREGKVPGNEATDHIRQRAAVHRS